MRHHRIATIAGLACAATILGCSDAPPPPEGTAESADASAVLEVSAIYNDSTNEHLFVVNADTVPSGWTTIRFTNASPMLHFVFLDHLPGDRTSADLLREVSPIFQEALDLTLDGRPEDAQAAFGDLPEWFGGVVFSGGPGFTSPGHSTEATIYLEPGNYMLECYVKTANNLFHWNRGMHADLHVTGDTSRTSEPTNPDIQVTLTDSGMNIEGPLTRGEHLVAVHFQEEHPGLYGKDLHVARLDKGHTAAEVLAWMDANTVTGLVSTTEAPAPATFVGGVQDMPLGNTAYFGVTLEPGDYVWASELPSAHPTYTVVTVEE